jgi:rhodanese-related sulfurtransferase
MVQFLDLEAFRARQADGRTVVLDVLSAQEYDEKRIPGSLSAPVEEPGFEDRVRDLVPDRSTPVVTYCASLTCQASTRAARKLEALGYQEVYDYKPGMQGWKEAGLPFETDGPEGVEPAKAVRERPARPVRGARRGRSAEAPAEDETDLPPM